MKKIILYVFVTITSFNPLLSQERSKLGKEFGFGVNHSWASRLDWDKDSFYHYDLLPIAGYQLSTSFRFNFHPFISTAIKTSYQRSGFEGRHFSELLEGSPFLFRKEIWSKYKIHHAIISSEIAYQINKKLQIKLSLDFLIKLKATEFRQEVLLTDIFGGDVFNSVSKEKAQIFSSTEWGNSIGVVYLLNFNWGVGFDYYLSLSPVGDKESNEFWFENRQIRINIFTFF